MRTQYTTWLALLLAAAPTFAQTSTSCNPTEKSRSSRRPFDNQQLTSPSLPQRHRTVFQHLHARLHHVRRRPHKLERHSRQRNLHLLGRRIHNHQIRRRPHHPIKMVPLLRPRLLLPTRRPRDGNRVLSDPGIRRPGRNRPRMARRHSLRRQSPIQLFRQRKFHVLRPRRLGRCLVHTIHDAQLYYLLD